MEIASSRLIHTVRLGEEGATFTSLPLHLQIVNTSWIVSLEFGCAMAFSSRVNLFILVLWSLHRLIFSGGTKSSGRVFHSIVIDTETSGSFDRENARKLPTLLFQRHKLARDVFMPTNLKDRSINGLFGSKAMDLFAKFPVNCFVNAGNSSMPCLDHQLVLRRI